MSGRAIGGQLRLAALALLTGGQGRQYRASDRETLRAAAVELQGRGLTLHRALRPQRLSRALASGLDGSRVRSHLLGPLRRRGTDSGAAEDFGFGLPTAGKTSPFPVQWLCGLQLRAQLPDAHDRGA